jgi:hypothetical protein
LWHFNNMIVTDRSYWKYEANVVRGLTCNKSDLSVDSVGTGWDSLVLLRAM